MKIQNPKANFNETEVTSLEQPILLTVKEAQKLAGGKISLPTLYTWTEIDGFPLVRVGRKKLIHREKFVSWLEQKIEK